MSTPTTISEPRTEPALIHAGDTVTWRRCLRDYPAGGGYTLSYTIISRAANYPVSDDMVVADDATFVVTIPATTTATWLPGQYRWQAYVSDGEGNRFTVDEGMVEILPNLQAQTGGLDDREPDEKILDAIVQLLCGKVLAGDAQRYTVHGRELQRYTFAELKNLRSEYALKVRTIRIRRSERVLSRTVRTGLRG